MKSLRKWLVEFFGFGQSESKGFIIFLGITFLFFTLSLSLPQALFRNDISNKKDLELLKEMQASFALSNLEVDAKESNSTPTVYSVFDPNTTSYFEWKKLGLKPTLANRIVSYRLKGGYFYKAEDLLKIYGMDDSIFTALAPMIQITVRTKKGYENQSGKKQVYDLRNEAKAKYSTQLIDINECDSFDLLEIKGIGPARASRIIRFRNALGGFYNLDQLNEIYGMDSVILKNLNESVRLKEDTKTLSLNMNSIEFKELLKHPYFDYNTTRIIINYRQQHGPFTNLQDLKKIKIIDSQWIKKVEPYLSFEPDSSKNQL